MSNPCQVRHCSLLAANKSTFCAVHRDYPIMRRIGPDKGESDADAESTKCPECQNTGKCGRCKGVGRRECACLECGDQHDSRCSTCDGTGECSTCVELLGRVKTARRA